METIQHEPEMVKGLEVLNFGQVELEKTKLDGSHTFATEGNLNVLYFDYYDKFILQLNNWRYALIPRLPSIALDNELETFSYQLPAYDGTYTLRLGSIQTPLSLENFETILQNTTKFTRGRRSDDPFLNQENVHEISGEQGGGQQQVHISTVESKIIPASQIGALGGSASKVVETRERSIERTEVMPMSRSSHPGTQGELRRYYERTGQSTNLGNGSYSYNPQKSGRKREKLRLKLRKMAGKKEEAQSQKWNPNMSFNRDFESIKRTNEAMVPVHEFKRQEIEAVLVSAKEIARRLENPSKEAMKEKAIGFIESVKEGAEELKEKIFGEPEEPEVAYEPGMIDVLKQGFAEIKEKIATRNITEESGAMRNAVLAAQIYQSVKDVGNKLKDATKQKIYHKGQPSGQVNEEEFDFREHPGMRRIIKDEYNTVKEKIAHRDEITHGDHGSLEKAYVAATVFDGVKDVTCKLFREGKYEIKEKLASMNCRGNNTERSPLRIFDDKYLDAPASSLGIIPSNPATERDLYSVPVIPGTTVVSSKIISTPPVKVTSHVYPSASTAERTLNYHYEGSQPTTFRKYEEETIRTDRVIDSAYELDPAKSSFMDKIKASIPFLNKKEPVEEQKEVIREQVDVQTLEANENHPAFMERVKGVIHRVEDKLTDFGSVLCSQNRNEIDLGERQSIGNKIMGECSLFKDKIENTAVQVPTYEPELFVTPTEVLEKDFSHKEEPIAGKIIESGHTYQDKEFEAKKDNILVDTTSRIVNVENNMPHYKNVETTYFSKENSIPVQHRNVETTHLSQENVIPAQQLQSQYYTQSRPVTRVINESVERRYAKPTSLYSETQGIGTRLVEVIRVDRSSENLQSERFEEGLIHYEA